MSNGLVHVKSHKTPNNIRGTYGSCELGTTPVTGEGYTLWVLTALLVLSFLEQKEEATNKQRCCLLKSKTHN